MSPDNQTPFPGQYQGNKTTQQGNQRKNTNDAEIAMMEQNLRKRSTGKLKAIFISIIIFLVIVIGVLITLIATGVTDSRVAQLTSDVEVRDAQILSYQERIEELKQAVADTTVTEVRPTTSLQILSTGSKEFWLIDNDFIAPAPLELQNSFDDINNSYIQVGSKFKFTPSENWSVNVKGATLELQHPAKIWGKIRALGNKDKIAEADMQSLIKNFFKGYPSTTISYRKVFIDEYVVGMMGKADIKVKPDKDSEPIEMTLNVGFAQRSDYSITFMFLNEKNEGVSQELIDLFLSSGVFGENKLKLE